MTVSQIGFNGVSVSWITYDRLVTGYIISYQLNGFLLGSKKIEDSTNNSIIIADLIVGETYIIHVVATSNTLPSEVIESVITIGIDYIHKL